MLPLAFIFGHFSMNTLATICFKFSSSSHITRQFLLWQIFGNIAGFLGVLSFTGLVRYIPLHVAFPVTQGLAIIGVNLLAARLLFHETIPPIHWGGTVLIIAGIALLSISPSK